MKRTQFKKAVALLLLGSMMSGMAVSADAAWFGGSSKKTEEFYKSWDAQLRDFLAEKQNNKNNKPGQNKKPDKENNGNNNPGQENNTDSAGSSTVIESEMTVVEDATTVENGEMLRASTYVLNSVSGSNAELYADGEVTLKYFPITMYNYDADTINAATHRMEVTSATQSETWDGMYFSKGSPGDTDGGDISKTYSYTTEAAAHAGLTWAQVQSGTYYSDEACTTRATVSANTSGSATGSEYVRAEGVTYDDLINQDSSDWVRAGNYYYKLKSGNYYHPLYVQRTLSGSSYFYKFAYSSNGSNYTDILQDKNGKYYFSGYIANPTDTVEFLDVYTNSVITGYTLTAGSETLATLDGTDTSKTIGVTLYTAGGTPNVTSREYAAWNWWNKKTGNNANGQKFYTGLVESELTANKDIVFTKPDAGIFNSDTTVKNIYTNVQLPFVYADQTYTFDASENGVYFHEDAGQGSSGTPASNTRLYFAENNTQGWPGMNYGDGSQNLWAPFNEDNLMGEGSVDYHFGMRTTIPFSMTTDGYLQKSNDTRDPIHFSFSGDDDVWVFIDGHLVIDLGGIHNRLDAEIDFAANTVTYSVSNDVKDEFATGNANPAVENFALTQTLFGNLIPQDRVTFAEKDSHELTIFYLERGAGSSNCKIEFNLPMKDTVTVQKIIDKEMLVGAGNSITIQDLSLSPKLLEVLNNLDFGFTIYKDNKPLANTTYNLLNVNGQVIGHPSTDANGHFTLKNGQTAKFVGEFSNTDGNTYYVVEDIQDGFIRTATSYTANAAGGSRVTTAANDPYNYYEAVQNGLYIVTDKDYSTPLQSDVVTVKGGAEAEDSLAFVFENYMNASLPRPSALPNDDKIVIDYGLPVVISPTVNDIYLGEGYSIEITGTPVYGTITQNDQNKFIYTLNQQMTGVEKIAYTMTSTAGGQTAIGTAYIYIIPATTMYYEENFGNMVTYTGKCWQGKKGTESNTYQEPGVVGTVGDSPYGSDIAYLDDSGDSNGTSYYADTTESAVAFSYTFTGTGTAFYARTTANTGLMQIKIAPVDTSTGEPILAKEVIYYRDTAFIQKDNDNNINNGITLYNIPVFDTDNVHGFDTDMVGVMEYGTYTVSVIVAKANPNLNYGKDFWLDGIRVYQPLNSEDDFAAVATSAYATDGEANMVNATLRFKLLCDEDVDNNGNWDNASGNFVLFTDSNQGMLTAEEYKNIGPKNEVYLYAGQSVTFTLSGLGWDANTNKVYLGMKAPAGVGNVTIGNKTMQINNTVDCYYDISGYGTISDIEIGEDNNKETIKAVTFTITAGENSLISLTNVRVTGNAEFIVVNYPNVKVSGSGK